MVSIGPIITELSSILTSVLFNVRAGGIYGYHCLYKELMYVTLDVIAWGLLIKCPRARCVHST